MQITFMSLLGLLLIYLKLTEVILWSWIWVLFPFWIGIATIAIVLMFSAVIVLAAAIGDAK